MPKILVIDTYYPPAWQSMPIDPAKDYEENLGNILNNAFGTGDFYSYNLQHFGWETRDVILNHEPLQKLWSKEHGQNQEDLKVIALDQILYYKPDVLFCQDLSFFGPQILASIRERGIYLAGQCSCPFPPLENVRQFQLIFTSFPHYVPKFETYGVKSYYNPLAFEPRVLKRVEKASERDIPILFVGGVGTPSHWDYGMRALEAVAQKFPQAQYYGYGYDQLPETMATRKAWRGEAWGMMMYHLLCRAKIVINRHGEVAQGYTNNMRCYEATGCGALLMTEASRNLSQLFVPSVEVMPYMDVDELLKNLEWLLEDEQSRQKIAANGQERTLREHCYRRRMGLISRKLTEVL